MITRFLICSTFLFTCAVGVLGQQKTEWMDRIERAVKEQLPKLELRDVNGWDKEGTWRGFSFSTNYKAGGHVEINELVKVTNVEDSFQQFVKIYDNLKGPNNIKRAINDYGEEGYVWFGSKDNEWHKLYFRRKNFTVEITYPEEISRKLAKIIDDSLPR